MSERAGSWARSLVPVTVLLVFASVIAAGVGMTDSRVEHLPARAPAADRSMERTIGSLRDSYGKLAAAQRDLEARLALLNADKDRVREQTGERPAQRANGKSVRAVVQAVDDKNEIYVISAGARDSVREGMELHVLRGDDVIGSIVIDRVFSNYASGTRAPGCPPFTARADDICVGTGGGAPTPPKVRQPR